MGTLIRLEGITKLFHTDELQIHALDNINLEIHEGEYVAFGGPSGCGKSTLLSVLGLLDTPTAGAYRLRNQLVSDLASGQRAHIRNREIGFVFQSFNLAPRLTIFQNVELPLVYRGIAPAQRAPRVNLALQRVGMEARRNHYPDRLSGGQQQRVAIARAIVGEPSILLADEPTGNLDSHNSEAVMTLLAELHATGATVCVVSHDARYTRRAQRTVHLLDGRIVEQSILR